MSLEFAPLEDAALFGISMLMKVTLILFLTLVAVRAARRTPASARHLLLTMAFAMLLVLPFAAVFAPPVRVEVASASVGLEQYVGDSLFSDGPATASAHDPADAAVATPRRMIGGVSARELLAIAWLCGVLLFAFPVFAGLVQVRRLRRSGLPWLAGQRLIDSLARETGLRRPVDVVLHESIAAPATCGLLRHAILFPMEARNWSDEEIRRAAIHEMEHIRRGDWLINGFARIVCAMYWFHPLVWIVWRRLGLEAEHACDDAVLRRAEATVYADQLVALASRASAHTRHPLLAMANRSDLVRRVAAVLDERQARGYVGVVLAAAIVVAAGLLTAVISPLQAVGAAEAGAEASPRYEKPSPSRGLVDAAIPLVITSEMTRSVDSRNANVPTQAAQRAAPTPQPSFEVASIRRNTVGFAADTSRVEGGRYTASNMTLGQLVRDAYRMPAVGGPDWVKDSPGPPRSGEMRFDVIATIPPGTPPDRVPLMLRTLLAERFKLVVHTETQERPAYALVHAREDKRLGSRLTPSTQQCQAEIEAGPLRAPVRRVTEDGKPVCGMMLSPRAIRGGGLTMRFLANALTTYAGRLVVDRTGLEGPFDFELAYAPMGRGGEPPSDDRPSIFVAVQEQLGLKLEPAVEPVEVLVIDQVSLPTEN